MSNPCLSFVRARMGILSSAGLGANNVSRGFENITRKRTSTSYAVCVMSTFTYAGTGSTADDVATGSVIWLPETALNTGKRQNPNVAIGRMCDASVAIGE